MLAPMKEKPVELWPSIGDYFVYDELIYEALTGDEARNELYRRALRGLVEDRVVVDLGTGRHAVLARLCVELGASRVYALDILEETARAARNLVRSLGLEEVILVRHGDVRQISLPEPVDVCVSEIVEAIGGAEGAAVLLNDARRFLKPGGTMVPVRSTTRIAAARLPDEIGETPAFPETAARYVRKIFDEVGREFDLRLCVRNFPAANLLSAPAVFEDLDFREVVSPEFQHSFRLEIASGGRLDGFLLWLVLDLGQGQVIDILENRYSWFPVFFPVFWPGIEVERGDVIEATGRAELSSNGVHPDYFLKGTLIRAGGERLELRFDSRRHDGGYKQTPFYQQLFQRGEIPVAPAPVLRSDDLPARP